jgi:hypothetical protein
MQQFKSSNGRNAMTSVNTDVAMQDLTLMDVVAISSTFHSPLSILTPYVFRPFH